MVKDLGRSLFKACPLGDIPLQPRFQLITGRFEIGLLVIVDH